MMEVKTRTETPANEGLGTEPQRCGDFSFFQKISHFIHNLV